MVSGSMEPGSRGATSVADHSLLDALPFNSQLLLFLVPLALLVVVLCAILVGRCCSKSPPISQRVI